MGVCVHANIPDWHLQMHVQWNYLFIPKPQRLHGRILGMDK